MLCPRSEMLVKESVHVKGATDISVQV